MRDSIAILVFYRLQYLCSPRCRYRNRRKEIILLLKTRRMKEISEMTDPAYELERTLHKYLYNELMRIYRKKNGKDLALLMETIETVDRSPLTLNKAFLQNFVFSAPLPFGIDNESYRKLRIILGLSNPS